MKDLLNKTIVSRDLIAAVKHFCFSNYREFYRRYRREMTISYVTFARAMAGNFVSTATVREIELLADQLGLFDKKKGGSDYLGRIVLLNEFCGLMDKVIKNFSMVNWANLSSFYLEHKRQLRCFYGGE